ncbi:hypothetical protein GCM10010236_25870 [Streptomyces eurythermus]|nr:hypothetical protein GCM10010236_25870 [Streptomyces eurythermus]
MNIPIMTVDSVTQGTASSGPGRAPGAVLMVGLAFDTWGIPFAAGRNWLSDSEPHKEYVRPHAYFNRFLSDHPPPGSRPPSRAPLRQVPPGRGAS